MGTDFIPNYTKPSTTGLFRFWCQKVLPAVYDDSLSYYELLCKVVNYLNDVIKHADTTGENVANLYNSFVQLQEYVNHYFDNLDVQEEINNKLDQFANDGTIANILLQRFNYNIVMISDSYGLTPSSSTNWCTSVKNILNLDDSRCHIKAHDGSGFVGYNNRPTFVELLTDASEEITEASLITHVIVCGGYNDAAQLQSGTAPSVIRNAISSFGDVAKQLFPNARIMIGCPAWGYADNSIHSSIQSLINIYTQCVNLIRGSVYIGGLENILHYTAYLDKTKFHPTAAGAGLIANCVVNNIQGGQWTTPTYDGLIEPVFTPVSGIDSVTVATPVMQIYNETVWFHCGLITFTGDLNINSGYTIKIADISNTVMFGGNTVNTGYTTMAKCVVNGVYHDCQISIADCALWFMPVGSNIQGNSCACFGLMLTGPSSL